MKWFVPALFICFVGGLLNGYTELHKSWCFLIGVGAFILYLFIKSIFITIHVMRRTKGAKKLWLDQNNNIIKTE